MSHPSSPGLLALHGVRVLGGPSVEMIANRFDLPVAVVREHLLDAQAVGWVSRHEFLGETWSLTDLGRRVNERMLAEELAATHTAGLVRQTHREFLPLNARHGQACTGWQLTPTHAGRSVVNDHTDPIRDDRILAELEDIDGEFTRITSGLASALARFDGYARAHTAALARARAGQPGWIDAPDRGSCQLVWIQFHEDLLATLGIPRGSDT
ncbi:MAG: transcriptional regulator [Propionibacteriaceae bacterium]|nr:transcriptional regulator [Propionibacteriaceae bacterium]